MDPVKLDAVKMWPDPTSVKSLQSFLGFCNYYNHFIKDYSKIIAPLTKLLQKDARFVWGKLQKAFNELQLALISAPILRIPCFNKPFAVHICTSDIAIGAILMQEYDGLNMHVYYFSKCLTETEARWSIYERELYLIIQALEKWHCYLVNRQTIVFTDHQPLKYFMSQPKLLAKQQHWLDFLVGFSLDIQYKPGVQNILPDALSRLPPSAGDAASSDCACVLSMILEPSWLSQVYEGQQTDEQLAQYLVRAFSHNSELVLHTVHSLLLLYGRSKDGVFQLVIPSENSLRQLFLEKAHCAPLSGHM